MLGRDGEQLVVPIFQVDGPGHGPAEGNYWLNTNVVPKDKEWGWHAPVKFKGDHSDKFGRLLRYNIYGPVFDSPNNDQWLVALRGGGIRIFVDGSTYEWPANLVWKEYNIPLDSSGRWKRFVGRDQRSVLATDDDIKKVLADVTDLRILGDFCWAFRKGKHQRTSGCLDGVEFGAIRVKSESEVAPPRPPMRPPDTPQLVSNKPPPRQVGENTVSARPPAIGEEWIREVRALGAEQQIEAVKDKLKDLNPAFEGEWAEAPGIEDGRIVSLVIRTRSGHVSDLTPLKALPHLRKLLLHGTKVTDLTPLQGLPLSFIYLTYSRVSDLSPLKGMKKLETLDFTVAPITDVKPLHGLKLRSLTLYATHVEDLSPLKGMPLKGLNIGRTRVEDLSPLKGMELETFIYNEGTPVKDIAVLKEMPLRWVLCDFRRERDEAVLRSIKTLETINRKPAAQFWKEVDGR